MGKRERDRPGIPKGARLALFHRVFRDLEDPLERALAALHWRGFLAMRVDDELFLSAGSHLHDLVLLARRTDVFDIQEVDALRRTDYAGIYRMDASVLADFEKLLIRGDGAQTRPLPRYACARVAPVHGAQKLFRIFATPHENIGFCDPAGFGAPYVREGWGAFKDLRFGLKVPVWVLEPGVALLVKLLPLLGLHTVMSCGGHADKPPIVYFFCAYNHEWARVALPQFLPPGDPFVRQWEFVDTGWNSYRYQWRLAPTGFGDDVKARHALYSDIQLLCRAIMDSHLDGEGRYCPDDSLVARARACKQNMAGPCDLENPEAYTFSDDHVKGFFLPPRRVEETRFR